MSDASTRYTAGVKLHIQLHIPPWPFGNCHAPPPRAPVPVPRGDSYWDIVTVDRVAFALDNPPVETEPPSDPENFTFTITGTKTTRRFGYSYDDDQDHGGPHVVTGYLDSDDEFVYVAKIYDGVDFPLVNGDDWDCMLLADRDYSIEAWAYTAMYQTPTVGGKIVPTHYGAWTFPLETDQPGRRRWVRMLLLELIPGETMLAKIKRATAQDGSIQYSLLPPEEFRLRVLKNVLEAESSIFWDAELLHGDLEARNVMVKDDGSVVIINFNQAFMFKYGGREGDHPKRRGDPTLPESPIDRFWRRSLGMPEWDRWIPESWLNNKDLITEWFLETWAGADSLGKYRPLSDSFLNDLTHKERSRKVLAALEKLGRKPATERRAADPAQKSAK